MGRSVVVAEYDSLWPAVFEMLRQRVETLVASIPHRIEHVGSTAVPGLAAKPVIDLDVVVDAAHVPRAITLLEAGGYRHRGNLDIEGREAFHAPDGLPRHNLYVCVEGGRAVTNHLAFRDHLRNDAQARDTYASLKRDLARRFPNDVDAYAAAKTGFVLNILQSCGLAPDDLRIIESDNRR